MFHCSHRLNKVLCTRLSVKICSHFILKWFHPNSFGEVCFLEESYENMQKFKFWKISEPPLFDIREYAFNWLKKHTNILPFLKYKKLLHETITHETITVLKFQKSFAGSEIWFDGRTLSGYRQPRALLCCERCLHVVCKWDHKTVGKWQDFELSML